MAKKNSATPNSKVTEEKKLAFKSKLECIAEGMQYFACSVPAKITLDLDTHGPVPVLARVNDSAEFLASLYPVGQGRHFLRIKNKICTSVGIVVGDSIEVHIKIRDRMDEIIVPEDLKAALKANKLEKIFESLPVGKRSYLIRLINESVKPATRVKKIQDALEEALARSEKTNG